MYCFTSSVPHRLDNGNLAHTAQIPPSSSVHLGGVSIAPGANDASAPAGLSPLDWTAVIRINLQLLTKMHIDVISQIAVLRGLPPLAGAYELLDAQRNLADAAKGEADKIWNDNAALQNKIRTEDFSGATAMSLPLLDERVRAVSHQLSCVWTAVYDTPRLAGLAQDFYTLNHIAAPRPLSAYSVTIGEAVQTEEEPEASLVEKTRQAQSQPEAVPTRLTFASVVARRAQNPLKTLPSPETQDVQQPSSPLVKAPKALAPRARKTADSSRQPPRLAMKKPAPKPPTKTTNDGWTTIGTAGHTSSESTMQNMAHAPLALAPSPASAALSSPPVMTPEASHSLQPAETAPLAQPKESKAASKKAALGKGAKKDVKEKASDADDVLIEQAIKQADEVRQAAEDARVQRRQTAEPLVAACRGAAENLHRLRLAMIASDGDPVKLWKLSEPVDNALVAHQAAITALEQRVLKTYPKPAIRGGKNETRRQNATKTLQKLDLKHTESITPDEFKKRLREYADAEKKSANAYAELFAAEKFGAEITQAMFQWSQDTQSFETLFLSY